MASGTTSDHEYVYMGADLCRKNIVIYSTR